MLSFCALHQHVKTVEIKKVEEYIKVKDILIRANEQSIKCY